MNTGASTREWVAVHTTRTARRRAILTALGLKKVLLEGAGASSRRSAQSRNRGEIREGSADDWLENHVYHNPHGSYYGIWPTKYRRPRVLRRAGPTRSGAAALEHAVARSRARSTGLCHAKGYCNFETDDDSTNLCSSGFSSRGGATTTTTHSRPRRASRCAATRSTRPGCTCKSARVLRPREDSPRRVHAGARRCGSAADLDELRAIIVNRMPLRLHAESHAAGSASRSRGPRRQHELAAAAQGAYPPSADARRAFAQMVAGACGRLVIVIRTAVLQFRNELRNLWKVPIMSGCSRTSASGAARAEQSVLKGLQDFVS